MAHSSARWSAQFVLHAHGMAGVRDHKELAVWQLSDELRERVTTLVSKAEWRARPRLADQLSRAAESPCPNIAEGFSRYYPKDNARFVRIARASLTEALGHLERARTLGLVESAEAADVCLLARRARGAATKYIRYLESAETPQPPTTRPRRPTSRSLRNRSN